MKLLQMFIDQSNAAEDVEEVDEEEFVEDKTIALFRVGDAPRNMLDDSPFEEVVFHRVKGSVNIEDFDFGASYTAGKSLSARKAWVSPARNGMAKLTNVYKRKDNFGALLGAIKRMKLHV